jgi:hypothetical protein
MADNVQAEIMVIAKQRIAIINSFISHNGGGFPVKEDKELNILMKFVSPVSLILLLYNIRTKHPFYLMHFHLIGIVYHPQGFAFMSFLPIGLSP